MKVSTGPALKGPRRLLRRLRDVMAGPASAQERLDQVVTVIAADMVAEVCSIYVRRAGDVLELFATEGLNPTAVHQTRLKVGEGLVGDIAAHALPLNLSDAQSHPSFAYRPETGEEIYHSLMGVPILRGGRVIGVLVVQNKTWRHYTDEEVEALEITAMVLAELVASGELVSPEEKLAAEREALLPVRLEGMRLNAGLATGTAVLHQPNILIRRIVAEDPEEELRRLEDAIRGTDSALKEVMTAGRLASAGEHRDVLEAYRMIAADTGWLGRIRDAIKTGLTAEAAVQQIRESTRARMGQISDPYLRERLHDLDDLANRLSQHLVQGANGQDEREIPDDVVLISRNLGPAELLDYDPDRLRALVLEEGSPTAHVCIVARALDIPVLGCVKDVLGKIKELDPVIVDADNAQLFIRPREDVSKAFADTMRARAERKQAYAAIRNEPAVTRDGVEISLNVNVGLEIEVSHLDETGAEGIGLYRTEIPFMVRETYPDVEAQIELYRKIFERADGRPVVFRTLDVGGDKLLPYFDGVREENPAMGWRAIRIALDRPEMLRNQVRAMLRAAEGRPLRIMFPMIAEIAEFDRAREIVDSEIDGRRSQDGPMPDEISVGAMLEVPSLLFQLPALLEKVDFLSVGSNDLLQFLFAADRNNPHVGERYDDLSPAVLTLLDILVRQCEKAGVPLALCGEMAGRPLAAMALIGLGFRNISMSPVSIGPVKAMIRSLNVEQVREYLPPLLTLHDHSVRERLNLFAKEHGVTI
ncbi:MAG: phosphoenolpyruvate--protein phosphotransferase [Proteobacteria bacterium]|nr:phosphoenolpyruvate--protein phosphotransferase [Pseudomonadota bacterium]